MVNSTPAVKSQMSSENQGVSELDDLDVQGDAENQSVAENDEKKKAFFL